MLRIGMIVCVVLASVWCVGEAEAQDVQEGVGSWTVARRAGLVVGGVLGSGAGVFSGGFLGGVFGFVYGAAQDERDWDLWASRGALVGAGVIGPLGATMGVSGVGGGFGFQGGRLPAYVGSVLGLGAAWAVPWGLERTGQSIGRWPSVGLFVGLPALGAVVGYTYGAEKPWLVDAGGLGWCGSVVCVEEGKGVRLGAPHVDVRSYAGGEWGVSGSLIGGEF